MAKKSYPLSKVYWLLEPGIVVLVSTLGKTGPNINKSEAFALTPGKAKLVQAPLIDEC